MCNDFYRCISVTKLKMHKNIPCRFDLIYIITVFWDHCFFREVNTRASTYGIHVTYTKSTGDMIVNSKKIKDDQRNCFDRVCC